MNEEAREDALRDDWAARIWAARITDSWRDSVAKIIETGRLLIEAREALGDHAFGEMLDEDDFPFGVRTAQRLMAIPRLATRVSLLPPSWGTLYEIYATLEAAIEDGTINPKRSGKISGDT